MYVTATMNFAFALRQHLSGSSCRTYLSDMKRNVGSTNQYFCADARVTCSALASVNLQISAEQLFAEVA